MWILCHLQSRLLEEYTFGFVWIIFFFKVLKFFDSVCGLACSIPAKLDDVTPLRLDVNIDDSVIDQVSSYKI